MDDLPAADPAADPAFDLAEVLRFYDLAGVDETIGESPVDRTTPLPPPAPAVAIPAEGPVETAYGLAAAAGTLDALKSAMEGFDGCGLKKTATNLVFGDGDAEARIIFVGEAPGAEEDRKGIPFIGPSGRLLDRMLASVGLERSQVFITNTVFWRPPGNRSPAAQEIAVCMPFLERIIELVDPDVLVAVGGPAATALLAQGEGVGRLRGRWFTYATPRLSRPVPATAIFHPAYLLRTPEKKRLAWRDLLDIKKKLAGGT